MLKRVIPGGGRGALPYMGYIGMCRCEGYGFQAVYSRIGYIKVPGSQRHIPTQKFPKYPTPQGVGTLGNGSSSFDLVSTLSR